LKLVFGQPVGKPLISIVTVKELFEGRLTNSPYAIFKKGSMVAKVIRAGFAQVISEAVGTSFLCDD